MKALIIPFKDKACDPVLKGNIGYKLLTTVEKITTAPKVAIAPPVPSSTVTKSKQMPIIYMASHLIEAEYKTLISRHIWSSEAITFQVIPMDPPCLDFFFTIYSLTTLDKQRIFSMVQKVWNNSETIKHIKNKVSHALSEHCANV